MLLHPQQSLPAQSWTFEDELIIRIGRATNKHVLIYTKVVSRRHVEVRQVGDGWEIVSIGANESYVHGERIQQVPVSDGVILRLARSGPQIQIRLGEQEIKIQNSKLKMQTI